MRRSLVSGIALALCAHSGLAQTGPTLGYVVDARQRSIRPLLGIAGSASYGGALDLGIPVDAAAVSASGATALLANGDGVFAFEEAPGGPVAVQVNGLNGSPDLMTIVPSGAFAAAYYARTQTLALIGPIGDGSPEVRQVQIPRLQSVPAALAISSDGRVAVLAVNAAPSTRARSAADTASRGSVTQREYAPSGAVLRLDTQSGDLRQIATVGSGSAVAFLPGDNDVVASDRGNGAVFVVRDIVGSAARTDLLAGDDRLRAPSSLALSADAQSVIAASDDGTVAVLSLSGADPVFLQCACTPAGPRPLNSGSALLLSDVRDGVAWMIDANAAKPRVLFIPAQHLDR